MLVVCRHTRDHQPSTWERVGRENESEEKLRNKTNSWSSWRLLCWVCGYAPAPPSHHDNRRCHNHRTFNRRCSRAGWVSERGVSGRFPEASAQGGSIPPPATCSAMCTAAVRAGRLSDVCRWTWHRLKDLLCIDT